MDRNQAKELLPIIQAYAEGKAIESRCIKGDTSLWYDDEDPSFDNDFEYRIKPDTTYRPFANAEECWTEMQKHQPFGWVKCQRCYYKIVAVSDIDVVIVNFSGDSFAHPFDEVMDDNTFADGTPFGVKVEE